MVLKCRQEQSLVVDILGLVATYLSRCNSILLFVNYDLPVYQFRVEDWDPVSVFLVLTKVACTESNSNLVNSGSHDSATLEIPPKRRSATSYSSAAGKNPCGTSRFKNKYMSPSIANCDSRGSQKAILARTLSLASSNWQQRD